MPPPRYPTPLPIAINMASSELLTQSESATPPEADLDAVRTRYVRNLAALYRTQPDLAAEIDALPFAHTPNLQKTRDDRLTARLPADDGKPVYLHSRYRPWQEAVQFAEIARRQATDLTQDQPDHDQPPPSVDANSYFLNGLGLGYHIHAFEDALPGATFIVAEPNLGLIKAAFCVTDFADLIHDRRLILLHHSDKARVHERLAAHGSEILLGLKVASLPYTARCDARFHAQMRSHIADFVVYSRLQMVTALRMARTTCRNLAANIPDYVGGPGIEVLRGRGTGFPAIVVAAGPSLARNIDQLPGLQDRAVIIAVQTVFKNLLSRGVRPNFVTSLDFHEVSSHFFQDISDLGDCALVAEPKAHWRVLDAYAGRKHVLQNAFVDNLLRETAPRRGGLKAGCTVAHLAFYLAEYLGCDPIILIGQDLAYSDGLYYPPGMPIEKTWQVEFNRFCNLETKQWERIARGRSIGRVVKDIHGRDVHTDEQLFAYAEQFQRDFAASPARVIHATEGGMCLAGAEIMTLRDAAAAHCRRRLPPALFQGAAGTGGDPEVCGRAVKAIEQRRNETRRVREIAEEMRPLLQRLQALVEEPREFNRLMVKVDALRIAMKECAKTYELVLGVSQFAELRRHAVDRRIARNVRETPQIARLRLQRDLEFVEALIEGSGFLDGILEAASERLHERAREGRL